MDQNELKQKLPGYIAAGLLILTTSLLTLWGTFVMYYEGWGSAFPPMWLYLVPALISLGLSLFALTWPRAGGWLLVIIGGLFAVWWSVMAGGRVRMTISWVVTTLPLITTLVITGVFLLLEARHLDRQHGLGRRPRGSLFQRNWRYLLAVGVPLLVFLIVSVFYLPKVLRRVDDGDRGASLVHGNGVSLIWAPQGPGWNWSQPDGLYPTWSRVALYGLPPLGFEIKPGYEETYPDEGDMAASGLCSYLSEDGTTLLDAPQHIWRMPTADEIVRSLVKGGVNAGCVWERQAGKADCELTPDKETPLWAPDAPPIYYWAADELDQVNAWYVSYDGSVYFQPKEWSNARHSYRCVREP
jgi:hypothetical protein